ncbi:LOW QUALITY PROTEIN: xenotropic and polytropic retrovirus receptor 1 homolog [Rhinatrema bivittatum]|uniref:LOW QUALITY PROTEIN: xenotropic and polytropic retrovirus receptor 1 homolog n=1 Tax=Rhinatrema bivittatum TaxID=194408 RepID=UPI00112D7823|nr:LOW QUALITY PROTEIN: xenotropic and polytropic retrovirus receptor 1 homolog [Rhinatrema bivittatum]
MSAHASAETLTSCLGLGHSPVLWALTYALATDPSLLQRHYASHEENFFQMCEKELSKVNTFYTEKLAEAQRHFMALRAELEMVQEVQEEKEPSSLWRSRHVLQRSFSHRAQRKTICDLKLALSELYLSLILLQNYQSLNFLGFHKITKKYDKLFRTFRGAEWKMLFVDASPFYTAKKNNQLIQEVESLFTNQLEGGDRQKAMKRLRVPPLGAAQSAPIWTTFRVGIYCGLIIALVVLMSLIVFHGSSDLLVWPLLKLYRGGFLIIEFIFLLGINNYGWRKAGVNHILIFELDPRNNLSYQHFFELAGVLGVAWCISVLNCLYSAWLPFPLQMNPLAFYSFMILLLINPTKTFYYKSRVWLLKLMCKVFTAPFHKVGFADFWLADQLNSLVSVFADIWVLACFYMFDVNWQNHQGMSHPPTDVGCIGSTSGVISLIQCIPPWIRFAQCLRRCRDSGNTFPHLVNAGKYSTVFIMVTFAALYSSEKERSHVTIGVKVYFYLWVVAACVSTIFTITWDLKMDWGLLDRNIQENKFLRDETVYPKKAYYYCAIAGDILLRIFWAVNMFFAQDKSSDVAELITSVLAPLEVLRRFIWNFFRLENEHLNNCGQFRAVRDISIAPLQMDNQTALEQMMDQEDEEMLGKPGSMLEKQMKNSQMSNDDDKGLQIKQAHCCRKVKVGVWTSTACPL